MPKRWITVIVAGALMAPATALAGGWATVGLSSTPDGLAPGEPWVVEIEVLQHGRTPLGGVQPKVTITEAETGAKRSVAARPTDRTGIYRAQLDFPRAGTWEYTVNDGFSQTHSYPPVRIGRGSDGAAASGRLQAGDGGTPWARLALAVTAGLLVSGLAVATQRRRRTPTDAAAVKA